VVFVSLGVLTRHSPGETDENHGKPKPGYLVIRVSFESDTPLMQA